MTKLKLSAVMVLTIFLIGLVGGIVGYIVTNSVFAPNPIAEWYAGEVAVKVSPHGLRKSMDKGDDSFILVDLRSPVEYEAGHITGAVNIPAYVTPDKSAYGDVDRIVGSFKELKAANPDKDLIIYCYSIPCMTGRKIGNMLATQGVYVKELGVGWNEWRYHWTLWNHEHEWNQTDVMDYVSIGPEPGSLNISGDKRPSCPIEGEFGC